jgi:hypothetical protein
LFYYFEGGENIADHVTDTETVTITVIAHGNLDVTITNYPAQVFVGQAFDVIYDVINNGGDDSAYGRALVDDVEEAGTRWDETITSGQTVTKTATITLTAQGPHEVKIEVGYTD